MRQPGEPSVEEILASIKQVIARDNRAVADDRRRAMAEPRTFDPAAEAAAMATMASGATDDDEVLDLGSLPGVEPAPLIADEAVSSMRESLAALATMAAPGAAPQIVRSGETSLEGLVRELLRPMLAEWLDKNLPPLVERLVTAEIARIVGKKM
jgi:cell pole-organizing protein PopZ